MIHSLFALLGAFLIAGLSDWLPLDGPPRPLAWGAILLLLPAVLTGTKLLAAEGARAPSAFTRVLRRSSLLAFLASYFAVLYPLGWARWTLLELGWRGEELVALLFLLFPAAALAAWAAPWTYVAERIARRPAGIPAKPFPAWLIAWARPVVVPGIAFIALAAAADWLRGLPSFANTLAAHRSLEVLLALGGLIFLFAAAPYLILAAWPTRPPPPGPLARRFAEVGSLLGVRLRSIGIWDERTSAMLNACVLGFLPGTRRVIFTRGICDYLDEDDLVAVLSHELGHVAKRHLIVHVFAASAFLLAMAPLERLTAALPGWLQGGAFAAYGVLFWGWFFGWMSRWFECEADLAGAAAVGAERYAGALRRVASLVGAASGRHGWRHFSLRRRIEIVAASDARTADREAVSRRCRRFKIAVAALLALAACAWTWCARADLMRTDAEIALVNARAALVAAEDLGDLLGGGPRREAAAAGGILGWLRRDAGAMTRAYGAALDRFDREIERAASASGAALEPLRQARRRLAEAGP